MHELQWAKPSAPGAKTGSRARRPGAQAVDRALILLKEIAVEGGEGVRLSDLAARTNLDMATAHRLLASLSRHGFIEQDARNRRYFLGLEFFSVAAASTNRHDLADVVRASLLRLHAATGGTAYFQLRSQADILCVDIMLGEHSAHAPELGVRRPIISCAGGVAILAALPDLECENLVVKAVRSLPGDPEAAIVALRDALIRARQDGYAFEPEAGATHGPVTLAAAVLNVEGLPQGALGLSIPEQAGWNIRTLGALVGDERRRIEDGLQTLPAGSTGYPSISQAA